MFIPLVLISALAGPLQDAAESQRSSERRVASGRTQTDQTVSVKKGTRLELPDCAGDVIVKTWNRDDVRVQATHSSRGRVNVRTQEQVLLVEGPTSGFVDIDLTVPAWLDLQIEGHSCSIDVSGSSGRVSVETVEGDIDLRDVSGPVDAKSIDGKITVTGSRGRLNVSTVDEDIEITKSSGEISADSIDGNVRLIDVQATAIEVSTVDGDITFNGQLPASSRYQLTSHGGDIEFIVPENSNATFGIRTYSGDVHTSLPMKPVGEARRGRRATYTLGNGSAKVELESFDGDVSVRKPGDVKKD